MVAVIVFTGMGLYSRYYPDTIGYPPLELNPTTAMKVSEELSVYMWVFTYCSVYTCGCEVLGGGESTCGYLCTVVCVHVGVRGVRYSGGSLHVGIYVL